MLKRTLVLKARHLHVHVSACLCILLGLEQAMRCLPFKYYNNIQCHVVDYPQPASIPEAPPISTSFAPSSISAAALSSSLFQSTGPSTASSSKALGDLLSLLSRSQAPLPAVTPKVQYHSVPDKCPWALKHTSRFWPAWALTRDIISIRLYRSCYIDPLK